MTTSNMIGRMLSASTIEEQVKTNLQLWFPTYLRAFERENDLPTATFPPPRNYSDRNKFDAEMGEELPKIVVISPGTIGTPIKTGEGVYTATWRVGVGIA